MFAEENGRSSDPGSQSRHWAPVCEAPQVNSPLKATLVSILFHHIFRECLQTFTDILLLLVIQMQLKSTVITLLQVEPFLCVK